MKRLTKLDRYGHYYTNERIYDRMQSDEPYPHAYDGVVIDKLAEYENAEEQGLLLRLPVVIEQTVYTNYSMRGWYFRDNDRPYQAKVVFIGLNNSEEDSGGYINISFEKEGCMMQFKFSDIGKKVFLTKEEAEKNLAELNDTIVHYI